MNPHDTPCAVALNGPGGQAADISIPPLVGKVYQSASVAERGRLLEQLLRPLGALPLLAMANGVF
jgi:hypothetical protein